MNQAAARSNCVAVRQHGFMEWAWEVIDHEGVTIAEGKAWTYSDAVSRAWTAERSSQDSPIPFRR
jgi:hypothetical protein